MDESPPEKEPASPFDVLATNYAGLHGFAFFPFRFTHQSPIEPMRICRSMNGQLGKNGEIRFESCWVMTVMADERMAVNIIVGMSVRANSR